MTIKPLTGKVNYSDHLILSNIFPEKLWQHCRNKYPTHMALALPDGSGPPSQQCYLWHCKNLGLKFRNGPRNVTKSLWFQPGSSSLSSLTHSGTVFVEWQGTHCHFVCQNHKCGGSYMLKVPYYTVFHLFHTAVRGPETLYLKCIAPNPSMVLNFSCLKVTLLSSTESRLFLCLHI